MQNEFVDTIKAGVLRKFPALGSTMAGMKFVENSSIQTAATDNESVFFNQKFMDGLTYDQQVFVFAHEVMHVAFKHIEREHNRNHKAWNIATDSVINQKLAKAGLPIIEDCVNMPEAIDKSAEEMYEKVISEYSDEQLKNMSGHDDHTDWDKIADQIADQIANGQPQQDGQGQPQNQSGQGQNQQGEPQEENENQNEQSGAGQNEQSDEQNQNGQNGNSQNDGGQNGNKPDENNKQNNDANANNGKQNSGQDDRNIEKDFDEINDKLKKKLGEAIRKKLAEKSQSAQAGKGAGNGEFVLGAVESGKPVLSWKKILEKELFKEKLEWSYRRADEDNFYQARLQKPKQKNRPITQVLLDTSGSVSTDLLRNFVSQLKPLFKESDIYVGCFDDEFYGFKKIETKKDIDNYKFKGGGGTNFNLALKAFDKDRKINKIVFTDGYDVVAYNDYNKGIKNLYWIIYENKGFSSCCGKIIFASKQQINKKQNLETDELTFEK